MANLMVLNPRRRRRKLSAKQIAAGFGGKRRRRGGARRRSRSKVVVVSANPKRSRRSRRVRALARVVRRRFRRNPISMGGFVNQTLAPAAFGAAGALAVDWLSYNLPIPASLRSPSLMPITNVGLSLLAGWGVSLMAGKTRGAEAAAGGIIVALYNFANQQLMAPGGMLNFGGDPYAMGYGSYQGAGAPLNRYVNGMGFVRQPRRRLNGANNSGFGPFAPGPRVGGASPLAARSQLGGPSASTKFRMMRNGGASGRALGYVGPAPTLGRYMSR